VHCVNGASSPRQPDTAPGVIARPLSQSRRRNGEAQRSRLSVANRVALSRGAEPIVAVLWGSRSLALQCPTRCRHAAHNTTPNLRGLRDRGRGPCFCRLALVPVAGDHGVSSIDIVHVAALRHPCARAGAAGCSARCCGCHIARHIVVHTTVVAGAWSHCVVQADVSSASFHHPLLAVPSPDVQVKEVGLAALDFFADVLVEAASDVEVTGGKLDDIMTEPLHEMCDIISSRHIKPASMFSEWSPQEDVHEVCSQCEHRRCRSAHVSSRLLLLHTCDAYPCNRLRFSWLWSSMSLWLWLWLWLWWVACVCRLF
jgi:hypothetical protein